MVVKSLIEVGGNTNQRRYDMKWLYIPCIGVVLWIAFMWVLSGIFGIDDRPPKRPPKDHMPDIEDL